MTEQDKPLTDEEIEADLALLSDSDLDDALTLARESLSHGGQRTHLSRALLRQTAALRAETATRTALRTQEARVSGLLADAGVSTDLVAGVTELAATVASLRKLKDRWKLATAETAAERDEMREARDDAAALRDRLKDTNAALRADLVRVEGERDEMREARDRIAAEADRARAWLAQYEGAAWSDVRDRGGR